MNSLNIITRVSPSSTPQPSRSNSVSSLAIGSAQNEEKPTERTEKSDEAEKMESYQQSLATETHYDEKHGPSEQTLLLSEGKEGGNTRASWWHTIPRDFASSILSSIRFVFATLASPGVYLIACFCDEHGNFAPWTQIKTLFGVRKGGAKLQTDEHAAPEDDGHLGPSHALRSSQHISSRPQVPSRSSSIAVTSESDSEDSKFKSGHARSKTLESDDTSPTRKSIRIKLNHNEDSEKRKHRKTQSAVSRAKANEIGGEELSAHLKSPTSPIAALTKYPRAPAPPRPLIPRRQPSYLNLEPPKKPTKTLILDLDETLIHSMSRGGRVNTGHMVEVRLNAASLGMSGNGQVGQHPILYWVNKRPYCDEFLRRVVKWFNLVVFTASVQEYADPVIDWLESEKKFFSGRYYRQHCTYRQGAYIKDLSAVEPDLSNVMILDNSPLSYLFHEGKMLCFSSGPADANPSCQTTPYPSKGGSTTRPITT